MNKVSGINIIVLLMLFFVVASCALARDTLVIGKVSDNPKKHYRYLKPMVNYIAEKMHDLGIKRGKVLMAKNNKQMIRYLQQGKVDWVTETVFSSVIFQDKAGAEIILRKWKRGNPDYYSIFFVRKDSVIHSLQDIKGSSIAFEDEGSTSAYFIPSSVLIKKNLKLYQLDSPREKPPVDKVGYIFSGEEINTSTMVYKGLVDVGTFSNLDWKKDDNMPELYQKEMKIIHKTNRFPRALESVRGDLDPKIKRRLKALLLKAHKEADAKNVLRLYQKTTKFDEINDDVLKGIKEARILLGIVNKGNK